MYASLTEPLLMRHTLLCLKVGSDSWAIQTSKCHSVRKTSYKIFILYISQSVYTECKKLYQNYNAAWQAFVIHLAMFHDNILWPISRQSSSAVPNSKAQELKDVQTWQNHQNLHCLSVYIVSCTFIMQLNLQLVAYPQICLQAENTSQAHCILE